MSVTETIRTAQLAKMRRESAGQVAYKKSLDNQAEYVREVVFRGDGASHREARKAQRIFYEFKNRYTNKVAIPALTSKKAISLWTSVAETAAKAGVDLETFMAAQFHFFDKTFGRCPEISQLRTEAAILRAQEHSGSTSKPVSKYRDTSTIADVMRQADKQVRDMCSAQKLSRAEFYRKFVLTGIISLPESFLKVDPAYQEVLKAA